MAGSGDEGWNDDWARLRFEVELAGVGTRRSVKLERQKQYINLNRVASAPCEREISSVGKAAEMQKLQSS